MGKKILLADDSITIQKVIELTFSDEDFEVVTVGNGRLAIERAQEFKPDLVLCDVIMPEKDGYEVCEFIRQDDALKGIPVLLLTGAFEPFDQARADKVGANGSLAKPFEPQALVARVKELLTVGPAVATPDAGRPMPTGRMAAVSPGVASPTGGDRPMPTGRTPTMSPGASQRIKVVPPVKPESKKVHVVAPTPPPAPVAEAVPEPPAPAPPPEPPPAPEPEPMAAEPTPVAAPPAPVAEPPAPEPEPEAVIEPAPSFEMASAAEPPPREEAAPDVAELAFEATAVEEPAALEEAKPPTVDAAALTPDSMELPTPEGDSTEAATVSMGEESYEVVDSTEDEAEARTLAFSPVPPTDEIEAAGPRREPTVEADVTEQALEVASEPEEVAPAVEAEREFEPEQFEALPGSATMPLDAAPVGETEPPAEPPPVESFDEVPEEAAFAEAEAEPPAAGAFEPPPAAEALEPPPAAEALEPPPAAEALEPPPAAEAFEPPPAAEAFEPPPAAEALEPPPAAEAFEPPPAAEAFEPPPAAEALEPPPAAEAPAPVAASEEPPPVAEAAEPEEAAIAEAGLEEEPVPGPEPAMGAMTPPLAEVGAGTTGEAEVPASWEQSTVEVSLESRAKASEESKRAHGREVSGAHRALSALAESASGASGGDAGEGDDLVDRVAAKVVERLSESAVRDVAWEVVPELAERLIRAEIEKLKAEIA